MKITTSLVKDIANEFDDQETQELIQAMVVELRRDLRKNAYGKDNAYLVESLIDQIQSPDFWAHVDMLINNFTFES
jgi:hypothetical protein